MTRINALESSALVNTYPQFPFTLSSGSGARVRDTEGREYWDLYGGHAVALLGHAHPAVTQAVADQAAQLTFYSNAVPIEIRAKAAERLVQFAPEGLSQVFFCNSGAEANENALKLAIQQTRRKRIAALTGAFHGRTLLALSATASEKLRAPYADLLCPSMRIAPNAVDEVAQIDETVAAVIVEPVLSMAGVVGLSADFLRALRTRCDEVGALLIYDEIQTGLGRLGVPFGAGEHGILPDFVTLAKGLANGIPIGAVLMRPAIAEKVALGDLGTTFGGGPVVCAALLAVLDTIEREQLVQHAAEFGRFARERVVVGPVNEVIGRGCLLGLRTTPLAKTVQQELLKHGFITGTSGDAHVLRLLPPINTPLAALDELAGVLAEMGELTNATVG